MNPTRKKFGAGILYRDAGVFSVDTYKESPPEGLGRAYQGLVVLLKRIQTKMQTMSGGVWQIGLSARKTSQ